MYIKLSTMVMKIGIRNKHYFTLNSFIIWQLKGIENVKMILKIGYIILIPFKNQKLPQMFIQMKGILNFLGVGCMILDSLATALYYCILSLYISGIYFLGGRITVNKRFILVILKYFVNERCLYIKIFSKLNIALFFDKES